MAVNADVPELVHMQDTAAREIGLPGAYDYGCQRISWLGYHSLGVDEGRGAGYEHDACFQYPRGLHQG